MNESFRSQVTEVGTAGLAVMKRFLSGEEEDGQRVKIAAQMAGQAIKIEHMGQIADQQVVSQTIRMARLLKDPVLREQFAAATQPPVVRRIVQGVLPRGTTRAALTEGGRSSGHREGNGDS